jgi:cytochrome c peroxidase
MKRRHYLMLLLALPVFAFSWAEWYAPNLPTHFPRPHYDFSKNPMTAHGVALGRVLFYDPILSKDSTISCASCHSPYNAFAHSDHALSHGINDAIGNRNAPTLMNLAWQPLFMWDGAANHLEVQALAPIVHPLEMGETLANVLQKLQRKPLYPPLFEAAFGDSHITSEKLLKALAQFQLSLVSANAPYDKVQRGEATFTPQEERGYILFKQHCNSCHTEPLFTNHSFANNGLPLDTSLNDYGRGSITQQAADSLLFKIPTLRNLSYSPPYMHDGRFRKLREVLTHYTNGISKSPTLAAALQSSVSLNDAEKTDLIAFLLTLNDRDFIFDKKHQFPKEILLHSEGY